MAVHLIVVEDQADVADMFMVFLDSLGYRVSLAHDGETALAIDARDPADLVITDYSMPTMNGDELAGHLKERRAELPIIMISGYAFNSDPSKGNVRVMSKPIKLMALADAITAMLDSGTGRSRH